MPYPRVLVITSCTGEKRFKPENQLTLEDFKQPAQLRKREAELKEYGCPAGEMYTGMQHRRLMEGVQTLRECLGQDALDVMILSAGYGLVSEGQKIVPYEVTFNGMKAHEVDAWAVHIGVHGAIEQAIEGYDLVFFLLGDSYLRAVALPVETRAEQTLVFLASKGQAKSIKGLEAKTFVMPLSNPEAKRYRYGLVGLKGFLFKRFAESIVDTSDLLKQVYENPQWFVDTIEQGVEKNDEQLALPGMALQVKEKKKAKKTTRKKQSKQDFLDIPDLPPAPNRHLGMQYFIPEWDDRVDPGYNFLTDQATENRDPYTNDAYAHELYSTPNYDGILVSKIVIDQNKKKRSHIQSVGIHKFLRFPGPIMGDCGAFGYIEEENPPYDTEEILDYYESLGFEYGVSIDHLIVGAFAQPGIREKRYELTLKNAEEFLTRHREKGYRFTPIGVAQGWDPESYAEAVKANINAGYDYIALGGLARAKSTDILEIMKEVSPHLKADTRLHLFGIARLNTIPAYRHLGITSFDSASFLRRAWLGAGANYHALSGKMYAAVRVPPVNEHGIRARRLVEAGVADVKTLQKLEKGALKALREYDAGKLDLESTLQAVLEFDELVELPRDGKVDPEAQAKRRAKHEILYRELLEEQPWKLCDCPLCQDLSIEVVIFRNNNRNRRRGFHNTYVFYKRFQDLLEQETKK
ncbi:MAG: tRNA-guanine transglycosylase DpdA [Cyanobacteria bacterium P01_B01_bin.77]